jgi:hypothetical protein
MYNIVSEKKAAVTNIALQRNCHQTETESLRWDLQMGIMSKVKKGKAILVSARECP